MEDFEEDCDLELDSDSMSSDEEETDTRGSKSSVFAANEAFSNNLLNLIGEQTGGNILISPMSLSTILALLKTGATGVSEKELRETLHLPKDSKAINDDYKKLLEPYQYQGKHGKDKHFTVMFASRIYIDDQYKLKEDFVKSAKNNFFSEVVKMDVSEPGASANKINKWVGASTNNKITGIISKGDINKYTTTILVNALYLKGNWTQKFYRTTDEPFYKTKNEKKMVKMMRMDGNMFPYTDNKILKAGVLQMDYEIGRSGDPHCMLIYLPNPKSSVDDLVKSLDKVDVSEIFQNMEKVKVKLSLPKFKMEMTHRLIPILKQLGLNSIFKEETAELGNIVELKEKEQLYITDIIQKVYIDVDETGTKAAAATCAGGCRRRKDKPTKVIEFKVNRPFLFQIVNRNSSLVLFNGICSDPTY